MSFFHIDLASLDFMYPFQLSLFAQLSFLAHLLSSPVHVGCKISPVLLRISTSDDPGGIAEEVVHLFKRHALRLWQDGVEEHGVGEVGDDEEQKVPPAHGFYGYLGHLSNQRVEGKTCHCRDGDALAASVRVEYFGGDNPIGTE
jgi:hypothetical protein